MFKVVGLPTLNEEKLNPFFKSLVFLCARLVFDKTVTIKHI